MNNLNASELQALLAAQSNSQSNLLFQGQGLGGLGISQSRNPAPAASSPADALRNSMLAQLLQQQAQEEQQQRNLLAQQLAALNGLQQQPNYQDNFALLLQQKQLQALQGLGANQFNSSSLLGPGQIGSFNNYSANKLDQLNLARLLQGQNQQQQVQQSNQHSVPPAGLEPASMMNENDALAALAPDRRRKGRTGTFPQKLHQMLSDLERQEGGQDIASFLPHGRAFAIHKPRDFVKHVMPRYFRMSRFSSFQRQLNLYDFQRITEGPDKGAYYHELFVQGRPILSTMMKRNKIKGKGIKKDGDEDKHHDDDSSKEAHEEEDESESPGEEPKPEEKPVVKEEAQV